ncbi:MAG: Ig-like domain-containing protein, partial [Eubacteriales bacterium]|nr:Ig-like domain-containing protein [Eubacteriales bacterium]
AAKKYGYFKATIMPENADNKAVTWKVEGQQDTSGTYRTYITSSGKLYIGDNETGDPVTGLLTVTATSVGNPELVSEPCYITVTPLADKVTINIDSSDAHRSGDYALEVANPHDNTLQLQAEVTRGGATTPSQEVAWKSSSTSVATVSDAGLVTAMRPGTAYIYATATDGSGKYTRITVTVTSAPDTVEVTGVTSLLSGKSTKMKASVQPYGASSSVTWEVTPTTAASIDRYGTLTARYNSADTEPTTVRVVATCKVYGYTGDDETGYVQNKQVVSEPFEVTIYQRAQSVSIFTCDELGDPATENTYAIDLGSGETSLQLGAAVTPGSAIQRVTWKTSSTKIATVDENGLVTAHAPGSVTIYATAVDGTKKYAKYYIVVGVTAQNLEIAMNGAPVTDEPSLVSYQKLNLDAIFNPTNTSVQSLTWTSSNTSLATVSSSGWVTAKKVYTSQKVTITATARDGSGVTDSVDLWIRPRATQVQIYYDDALTSKYTTVELDLNADGHHTATLSATCLPYAEATETSPGEALQDVVWYSYSSKIATVDNNGLITAQADGTTYISATAADGSKQYAYLKVIVTCKAEKVIIDPDKNVSSVAYGKSIKLNATVEPDGVYSRSVTWSMADDASKALAYISSSGTLTAKSYSSSIGKSVRVVATTKVPGITGNLVSSSTDEENAYEVAITARTQRVLTNYGYGKAYVTAYLYTNQLQLSAACEPIDTAGQEVTWSTSSSKIATVDENGLVTFQTAGRVSITVKAADGTGVKTVVYLNILK